MKIVYLLLVTSLLLLVTACSTEETNTTPTNPTPIQSPPKSTVPEEKPTPPSNSENKPNPVTRTLVSEIYDEAKQGKVFFVEFVVGIATPATIEKTWGTPDEATSEYLLYEKKHYTNFTLINGIVNKITSDHPKFQMILANQVETELGKPLKRIDIDASAAELVYQSGNYQVIYGINTRTKTVSYISVTK